MLSCLKSKGKERKKEGGEGGQTKEGEKTATKEKIFKQFK